MPKKHTVVVLSDPHYAGPLERERPGHESKAVANPFLRVLLKCYRRYIWLRDPLVHNHMLDRFIQRAPEADLVVANGDYSCDTAFIGVGDEGSFESAATCIGLLRERYAPNIELTYGDHELGKLSMFGGRGGLRIASWRRAREELGLTPMWTRDLGDFKLIGIVSSLFALPVYAPEALPEELPAWQQLRSRHLHQIQAALSEVRRDQRIILFCHDPTALPFLYEESAVRASLAQLDLTIVGHLHTPLVWRMSRLLAGMPRVTFMGNAARRLSTALNRARLWKPFKPQLCPSLTGCQLLKDGGFLELRLPEDPTKAASVIFHRLHWAEAKP